MGFYRDVVETEKEKMLQKQLENLKRELALCKLASKASKKGYMGKYRERYLGASWRLRYFVLDPEAGTLSYFANNSHEANEMGSVHLKGCEIHQHGR